MVKKLFKYEWIYYLRSLLPFEMAVVGLAILGRILLFFETDTTAYSILFWSTTIMFIVACVVTVLMSLIFGVTRFYRNLFTAEGYLSFTLPVTVHEHLLVKVLTAAACSVITLVVILLAGCIFTAGDVLAEVIKAINYLADLYFKAVGTGNGIFYIVEAVLLLITAIIAEYLLYDTCIAIGQRANKNRVLAAVGVYFVYYVICQVLGTVAVIVLTAISETAFVQQIIEFINAHPLGTIHTVMWAVIAFNVVMSAVYYVISYTMMRKRLNLE